MSALDTINKFISTVTTAAPSVTDMRAEDIFAAPPFPLHVFPDKIRKIVEECEKYLSYPRDFTAAGILTATSIAIGRTHEAVYIGRWTELPCLYMAIVAPPGTAKTHPLVFALNPIIQANKKAIRDYNQQRAALEQGGITTAPKDRQCLFGDFTIEALIKAAVQNKRGISVYNDELRGFFQNFNRYNSGSEQEFWLQNWSGSPYPVTRMGRKYFLEKLGISIVGTIQPSLLDDLGKNGRSENGFIERFLFVFPDKVDVLKIKKKNERTDTHHVLSVNYNAIMEKILSWNLAVEGYDEEDDVINMVSFSDTADDLLTDYLNQLKDRLEKFDNENVRNIYSKLQTYCIRFALIINRLRYACEYQSNKDFPPDDERRITTQDVQKAQDLTEYFLLHAMKANSLITCSTPVEKLPKDLKLFYKSCPIGQEIGTKDLETKAVNYNLSRAKLYRLLNEPNPNNRLFQKVRHGIYERLY